MLAKCDPLLVMNVSGGRYLLNREVRLDVVVAPEPATLNLKAYMRWEYVSRYKPMVLYPPLPFDIDR